MPDLMQQFAERLKLLETRQVRLERLESALAGVGAKVFNSATITISNATHTALTFDSEDYDTDAMHSTTSNTSRLTCNTAGRYIATGHVQWEANATGTRALGVRVNGSTFRALTSISDGNNNRFLSIAAIVDLTIGDYIELTAYQASGGDLDVQRATKYSPEFAAHILP